MNPNSKRISHNHGQQNEDSNCRTKEEWQIWHCQLSCRPSQLWFQNNQQNIFTNREPNKIYCFVCILKSNCCCCTNQYSCSPPPSRAPVRCGLQVAARILEFERDLPGDNRNFDTPTASIELWDVSGNQQYERTYPAIMQDCDAVILVYDAVDRAQEQEVTLWFEWFVTNSGLDDRQRCLVLAHSSGVERPRGRVTPPRQLQSAAFATTNFEEVALIEKEFVMLCERVKRGKEKSNGEDRK